MSINHKVWASVALVFYQSIDHEVLVIQRAFHPKDPWSGHLSFPGGKLEQDESPLEAAIRECHEEIGLYLSNDQLLLSMPTGVAGSTQGLHKTIQPFVFIINEKPTLTLNTKEVRQVFWLSITNFKNPSLHTCQNNLSSIEPQKDFPGFPLNEHFLWGFSYETLKKAIHYS